MRASRVRAAGARATTSTTSGRSIAASVTGGRVIRYWARRTSSATSKCRARSLRCNAQRGPVGVPGPAEPRRSHHRSTSRSAWQPAWRLVTRAPPRRLFLVWCALLMGGTTRVLNQYRAAPVDHRDADRSTTSRNRSTRHGRRRRRCCRTCGRRWARSRQ